MKIDEEQLNDLKGYVIVVAAITIWFLILKEGEPFDFEEKFAYLFVVGGLTGSLLASWFEKGATQRRRERIYNKELEKRNKKK